MAFYEPAFDSFKIVKFLFCPKDQIRNYPNIEYIISFHIYNATSRCAIHFQTLTHPKEYNSIKQYM